MKLVAALLFSLPLLGHSQELTAEKPVAFEAEASIVKVGGNTTSDTYAAKEKLTYKFDANSFIFTGRYMEAKSSGIETAKQWDAALRYERELSNKWSVFIQHGAESDRYAGYVQRDNTDLGGKYFFTKKDDETFLGEAGYRHTNTLATGIDGREESDLGRLYLEYSRKLNETVTGKLWVEYLHNFEYTQAYLYNYEPSLNVMMNEIFSLKVAYLVKYHNAVAPGEKKEDTILTTALVAKF